MTGSVLICSLVFQIMFGFVGRVVTSLSEPSKL
jgi:hypothetical protein